MVPESIRLASRPKGLFIITTIVVFAFVALASFVSVTSEAQSGDGQDPNIPIIAPGSAYRQTNLDLGRSGVRARPRDPLLVNPWGISLTATSPFWVANNGTSTTQLIRGDVRRARPSRSTRARRP